MIAIARAIESKSYHKQSGLPPIVIDSGGDGGRDDGAGDEQQRLSPHLDFPF